MNHEINVFFNGLEGSWLCNQTIYYANKKTINNRQNKKYTNIIINYLKRNEILVNEEIHNTFSKAFTANNTYQMHFKNFFNNNTINHGNFEKQASFITYKGKFQLYYGKCLKIVFTHNNVLYTEYLLKWTNQFQTSIGFIKINENYAAVKFTSKIKILIN